MAINLATTPVPRGQESIVKVRVLRRDLHHLMAEVVNNTDSMGLSGGIRHHLSSVEFTSIHS